MKIMIIKKKSGYWVAMGNSLKKKKYGNNSI